MLDTTYIRQILQFNNADALKHMVIDEQWPVKTVRYRFADILATRIAYKTRRIEFANDQAMTNLLTHVASRDSHDGMYVPIEQDSIPANAKITDCDDNIDITRINLLAKDKTPLPSQPLFVSPQDSRMDSTGCGTLWYVEVSLSTEQRLLPLRNNEGIIYLKPQAVKTHLRTETPRRRTITRFGQYDECNYDRELRAHSEQLHARLGYTPDIEEISVHEVVCALFAYREVVGGDTHYGAVVDVEGTPEVVMPLDNMADRIATGMKNSIKVIGTALRSLTFAGSHNNRADNKKLTRLLMAVAVADGEVSEAEKECLLEGLRHTAGLTTGEQAALASLLTASDASFLSDDDFLFNDTANARKALDLMKKLAASDGESHAETQIIQRLQETCGFLEA